MIWKTIHGTDGAYQVSDTGLVKTTKTGRILKPAIDQRGYERVCLFKADRDRRYKVHRLVAAAFIPNPENLPQVNHIDGNKRNNHASNLEWITNTDNMKHAKETGLRVGHEQFCESRRKRVIATNIQTGESIVFESILAAIKGIGTQHVFDVLKGKRKQAKGYTFALEEDVR
jgi:hypothetical protein